MICDNHNHNIKSIITLRILLIIAIITGLFPLVSGIIGLFYLNFYGIGLIVIGLGLIGFCYWLLEYNGVKKQFIKSVDILNDRIIFIYYNENKKIIIPYNKIKSKEIRESGVIWYFSDINENLSHDIRPGLITSTLLDKKIFQKFEESLNNYLEKRNIKLHEK